MWRGAALLLLCLVTFTFGLSRSAIQDSDEAFYAEAGREMLAGGDWITPHYNFEVRLQKPILFYWVVAATYRLAGVGEAAARTGAALSGIGLAFVAYFVTRRWIDEASAWLSGAIVATGFGVVPIARQSLPDVPLAFFVSVACWCAIEAFTVDARSSAGMAGAAGAARIDAPDRSRRVWLYVSAVAAAFGALTKGPIAIVLPAAVIVPLLVVERWRTRQWPAIARPVPLIIAAVLFLVVAAPWYVAVVRAQGIGYLHQFFIGENLDRFATSQNNVWRGYDYIPVIVFGLLPWSVFGLLWIRPILRRLRRPQSITALELRLACWTLGPFAVFFVSIGSQPRYILPCLVPIAILLARTISSGAASLLRERRRAFLVAGGAAGASIAAIGALFYRARPLLIATNPHWSSLPVLLMIGAGFIVAVVACLGRARAIPIVVAAAATAGILMFELSIVAPGRPEPVEVIAAAVRAAGPVPEVCACGAFARSLDFYTHLPTVIGASDDDIREFLGQPDRVLAAVDAGALARIESTRPAAFPRLAEVSYVNTSVWQRPGDSLIHPDLRYLQRVILISNR